MANQDDYWAGFEDFKKQQAPTPNNDYWAGFDEFKTAGTLPDAASQTAPQTPGFIKSIGTSAIGSAGSGIAGVGTALEDVGLQRLGTPVREYGEGIQQANPSSISQFSDILDKPKQFAGEALGQIGSSIAATGGGALIGRGLGTAIGAALPIPGAAPALGALGSLAGGFASNLAGEYGETRANQREMGFNDPTRALAAAVPAAALDYAADRYVGKIGKLGQLDAIPQGMTRPGFMAREALKGALIEGPVTEVPQTVLERLGGGKDIASNEALNEYGIAGAMGALGGGVVSGGISGFAPYAPPQQDQPAITPEQPAEPQQPAGLGSQWETPAFTNYPRQPDVPPTSPVGMTPEEAATVQNPLTVEPTNKESLSVEPQGLGSRWQTPAFTINPNQPVLGDVLAGAPNESPETPVAPGTDRVGSAGPEAATTDLATASGPNASNEPGDGLLSSTGQFGTGKGLATDPAPAAPVGGDVAGSPGDAAGQANRDVLDAGQGAIDEAQNTGLVGEKAQVAEQPPAETSEGLLARLQDFNSKKRSKEEQVDLVHSLPAGAIISNGSDIRTIVKESRVSPRTGTKHVELETQTLNPDTGEWEVADGAVASRKADGTAMMAGDIPPTFRPQQYLDADGNRQTENVRVELPNAEQPPARGREEVTGTTEQKQPWQMRYEDYLNTFSPEDQEWEGLRATEHRASVQRAVNDGLLSADGASALGYPDIASARRKEQIPGIREANRQNAQGVTPDEIDNSANNKIRATADELKKLYSDKPLSLNEITKLYDQFGDVLEPLGLKLQIGGSFNNAGKADHFNNRLRDDVKNAIENVFRPALNPQEPTDAAPTPRDPGSDATGLSGGSRPTGAGELGVAGGTELSGRGDSLDGAGGPGTESTAATGLYSVDSVNRPALAPRIEDTQDNAFRLTNTDELGGVDAVRQKLRQSGIAVPGREVENGLQFNNSLREKVTQALTPEPTNDEQNQLPGQPEQPAEQEESAQAQAQEEVGQPGLIAQAAAIAARPPSERITDEERDTLQRGTQTNYQSALQDLEGGKSYREAGITFEKDGDLTKAKRNGLPIASFGNGRDARNRKKLIETLRGNLSNAPNQSAPVAPQATQSDNQGTGNTLLPTQAEASQAPGTAQGEQPDSQGADTAPQPDAPAKAPWDDLAARGESWKEDRWHNTRVQVAPSMDGDKSWEGTVHSVLKTSTGPLLEVRKDGQTMPVRVRPDRISVLDLKDSEATPEAQSAKPTAPTVTPEAQQRPEPGFYQPPANVSSQAGQTALASRGGRLAMLDGLNQQVAKTNPTAAYSPDEIQNAADDRIDAMQDWLVSQQKPEQGNVTGNVSSTLAPTAEQAQDPWQMTQDAFIDKRLEEVRDSKSYGNAPTSYKQRLVKDAEAKARDEWYQSNEDGYIAGKPVQHMPSWALTSAELAKRSDDTPDATFIADHKESVRTALSEGKPVPANVLAEFPDLSPTNAATSPVTGEAPTLNVAQRGQFNGANSVRKAIGKPALTEAEWLAEQQGAPAETGKAAATGEQPPQNLGQKLKANAEKAQANHKFTEHDAVAREYGFSVGSDGVISKGDKPTGVVVQAKKGRLQLRNKTNDQILASYAGGPERLSTFLEKFWYAEKKPAQEEVSTHVEPGKPAEPTTPTVIKDAIETGLDNTNLTPKQMGEYLSKRVDALMAEAYDDTSDPFFDEQHLRILDKTAKTLKNKRNDEDLIEKATGKLTVIINIPGDGKFKILNTRSALSSFKTRALKNAGFKNRWSMQPVTKDPVASGPSTLDQMIEDGEIDNALEYARLAKSHVLAVEVPGQKAPIPIWHNELVPDILPGVDSFYVGKANDGWRVSEAISGGRLGPVEKTKSGAIAAAKKKLAELDATGRAKLIENIKKAQDAAKAKHGDDVQGALMAKLRESVGLADMADESEAETIPAQAKPTEPKPKKRKVSQKARAEQAEQKPEVIEDFGQKLEGARKDMARDLSKEYSDDELASLPLSKIWPASQIDAIEDPYVAAFAFAARNAIPAKPRSSYKVKEWVETVKLFRNLAKIVIENGSQEKLATRLEAKESLKQFAHKVNLLAGLDREQWKRVGEVGVYPDAYTFVDGQKTPAPYVRVQIDGKTQFYKGATSIADVVEKVGAALQGDAPTKKMEFEVRGRPGAYFINKKGDAEYRKLKTFSDSKEALKYVVENYDDLVSAWESVKETDNVKKSDVRKAENLPRTGQDWRNGKDVTPEQFVDELGFRGGQFGNWVKQGANAQERQWMLNSAYDALMDLANIAGIPPKAISLNGTLGISFGARGGGSASAHFESGNLVINLTKTRGAGTLAHEWFHALDNYFARMRGIPEFKGDQAAYRNAAYVTYNPENYYIHKSYGTKIPERNFDRMIAGETVDGISLVRRARDRDQWQLVEGVRPQVGEAFAKLVKALNESPMAKRASRIDKGKEGYWSRIIERAARSFENYVIAKMQQQGYNNDYLANVIDPKDFTRAADRYPYLMPEEVAPIEEAFDNLFDTIETRETDQGVAMFSRDARFSFAGQQAATADTMALSTAQSRLNAGENAETVRQETGWFKGKDGRFRFEINDADAKLKNPSPDNKTFGAIYDAIEHQKVEAKTFFVNLGDVLDHPALFAAYPRLSTLEVDIQDKDGASYRAANDYNPASIAIGRNTTPDRALSYLLHEIQHGIQRIEGFATGGSPLTVDDQQVRNQLDLTKQFELTPIQNQRQKLSETYGKDVFKWPAVAKEKAKALKAKEDAINQRYADIDPAVETYRRLAGEVEARNVQTRQTATDAERRALSPQSTQDVADYDVIVTFNGKVMENAPMPRNLSPTGRPVQQEVGAVLSRDAVQARIDAIRPKLRINPKVTIQAVDSEAELPADIQAQARKEGAVGQVIAVHQGNSIYLVAGKHDSAAKVEESIYHEATHYGANVLFGRAKHAIYNRLFNQLGGEKGIREYASKLGLKMEPYFATAREARGNLPDMRVNSYLVDEFLANAQGTKAYATLPQKIKTAIQEFYGAIRNWLRQQGFAELAKFTDADLAYLLRSIHKAAQGEVATGRGKPMFMVAFSESEPQTSRSPTIDVDGVQRPTTNSEGRPIHPTEEGLRNFWRWFGSSQAVDDQGRPIVVYHGTDEDFTVFDKNYTGSRNDSGYLGRGFYFSSSEMSARSYQADPWGESPGAYYLRIVQPQVGSFASGVGYQNAEKFSGNQDGAIWTHESLEEPGTAGSKEFVVRDPEQIKSATDNIGTFDGTNPDIRFSRQYTPEQQGGWNTPVESKMDDLIRTLQNKHIDTKRVVEAIKDARGAIEDRFDPELKIDLYDGRVANRLNEFLLNEVEPFYKALGKSGVSVGELEKYLHARHAEERNEQMAKVNKAFPDGGSGMTNQEAWDYLASVPNRAVLDKLAEQVDAINRGTKRLLVDEGLETQATIDAWDGAYQHYVPLFREEAEGEQRFGNGTGPGFSVRGPASKRAMGSSRNVVDILANSVMARERALTRAEKNRVSTALFGAAVQNPADDFWRAVDPDKSAQADMQDWLSEQGLDDVEIEDLWREPRKRVIDKRTGQVAYRLSILDRFKDNVVSLRIDGRDKFIFFNQNNPRALEMARALKNLDTHDLGTILTGMRYVTRWISSVNTQFNPIFGITNIIRDTGAGLLNLESTDLKGQQLAVLREVPNALMGIYRDVRADRKGQPRSTSAYSKLFEEYEAAGGETGYRDMFRTSQDRSDALQKIIDPSAWADTKWGKLFTVNGKLKAPYEMARRAAKPLFDWLSDYNRTLENGVRLAAYKVAKDNGMSIERAAQLAKNLTVNFNKKGQIAQQAGAMYAFFNASMQGSARIAETLLDKRGNLSESGKMIVKGGMLLGVAQALMLAGYDDDEPPEFVREKNFVIPLPDGKYASFPYPLGFHILPNTGRVLTDILLRGKPGDQVASLLGSFIDAFNPIGSAGMSLQTLTPTAIDPLAALAENKDWTGKPIAKENFSSLSPTPGFTRAKDTASWFGKAIAEMANTLSGGTDYVPGAFSPTPDQIDYLIGQATGGVGRELMKAQQLGTSLVTGEEIPPYKVPGLGRFFGSVNSQAAESSRFYDNLTHLNMVENTLRGMRKDGKNVAEYLRETPEARLVKLSNTIETDIRELRAKKRDLIEKNAPKMQVQFIENAITSKMKRLNEAVSRLEK